MRNEFIALRHGLRRASAKAGEQKLSRQDELPGEDAAAIHGRFGARVALLQSPILRERAPTIHHQPSTIKTTKKCNLCAREKLLPLYRNTHLRRFSGGVAPLRCAQPPANFWQPSGLTWMATLRDGGFSSTPEEFRQVGIAQTLTD